MAGCQLPTLSKRSTFFQRTSGGFKRQHHHTAPIACSLHVGKATSPPNQDARRMAFRFNLHDPIWRFLLLSLLLDFFSAITLGLPIAGEVPASTENGELACARQTFDMPCFFPNESRNGINTLHQLTLVNILLDIVWAPLSSFLLNKMYGNRALSRLQFWKEILPYTDILPVATLSWLLEYTPVGRAFARAFGLNRQQTAPTRPV